jgi:L-iditol 2-dehydrogenase
LETEAARLHKPLDVRVEKVQLPDPGARDVLVKIEACGVCPFDIRLYKGLSTATYPKILGHEMAGTVLEVGQDVTGFKKSDKVVVEPAVRCNHCFYCLRGQHNLCLNTKWPFGGFAKHVVAPETSLHKFTVISGLEASFTEPLSCCLNGMMRADLEPGSDVAIIGDGPIGLLHLQLAHALGAARVIVTGMIDQRLERARKLGAVTALNAAKGDAAGEVKKQFENLGADVVVVAVGSAGALQEAIKMVKKGGRIIQFAGIYPEVDVPLGARFIHYSEVWLTGSSDSTPFQFARSLKLLEFGRVKVSDFVTHEYRLADAVKGIETAADLSGFKVMIRPWG